MPTRNEFEKMGEFAGILKGFAVYPDNTEVQNLTIIRNIIAE
jgi:hypothetical protein